MSDNFSETTVIEQEAIMTQFRHQDLPPHIQRVFAKATCLYSKYQVEQALDQMAAEINLNLAATNPIFLCVVVGGIIPMGHLLTRLNFPLELDYVHATRYQGSTRGQELVWKVMPSCNMKGRTVVVVDDILDGGVTLSAIVEHCQREGAKHVHSAVLVDKKDARLPGGYAQADFCGLLVAGQCYVFGYGMDYKGYLRNVPGIYRVAPEHE